jgi:tellurium resistance protein TerZ
MALSLQKGSSLSLTKEDGSALTKVRLGLGWDAAKRGLFGGGEIDLDASAVLLSASGQPVDIVYFGQLGSKDGSVRHSGDNLTGAGDGDDEQIAVNLAAVPANVQSVVFVITSYSGQKFNSVKNVYARVVDTTASEKEVVRYNLAESDNTTANVIAKVSRQGSGWAFTAIGEYTNGKTAQQTLSVVSRHA